MTKTPLVPLAACLVLSGCSLTRIEESRGEGPAGEVEFKALRRENPDRLTGGYSLALALDGALVAHGSADPEAPLVLKDLKPGLYEASIRGVKIGRHDFEVEIKAGTRTSIAVLHRNVRRSERTEAVAIGVGKAIVYTVGFIVYVAILACTDADDEDACDRCHASPCCCAAAPPPPKKFSATKKP